MSSHHSKTTIISMAVIASAFATLLHEGLGHGVTAWLRGDIVTELTSNHLTSLRPDRLVEAGGTLVNLAVGVLCMSLAPHADRRANLRYFLWMFGALNLLPGAGYFLFSGIFGFGDWQAVITGLPHQLALRIAMTLFGAILYVAVVKWIAINVRPFVDQHKIYNTAGRLPYYVACLFSCIAGAFDPLGIKLLLVSTMPAAFGGSSGLMWADSLMPRSEPTDILTIQRSTPWLISAIIIGTLYVAILGPGIKFHH